MATFGPYPARCEAIHDGDTATFSLDVGFGVLIGGLDWNGKSRLSCRFFGINAPELATPEGKAALAYLQTVLKPGDRCTVLSHGFDKFGSRFDGTITLTDGRDLATLMLDSGHAVPYS